MAEPVRAKTPSEVVDYQIDWAAQLVGDSIQSSTWAVQSALTAVVSLTDPTVSGTKTTVWVNGGTAGTPILLSNTVITDAGRTLVRTLAIAVDAYTFAGDSHAQTVLAAIEAVIERRATVDQESYSIDGRSLSRTPLAELYKFRARYMDEVAREAAAAREAAGLGGSASRIRTTIAW